MDRDVPPAESARTDGDAPARRDVEMDADAYLERIGVDPASVETADLDTLDRLQRAHVHAVPFENLSIVGDPFGDRDGEGVVLSVPHLYEKIVKRERGGYCFELNGLFHWLLVDLGYDVDRVAARITGDGGVELPANHHVNVVDLDRRYVTDVGTGTPKSRRPVPLDGSPQSDRVGVAWRVVPSDRPDATYRTEYRRPGDTDWTRRYVFEDAARDLDYFAATNDYLQSAPESTFTDHPVLSIATEDGYLTLSGQTLTESTPEGDRERTVTDEEWNAVLQSAFGLDRRTDP